jgi:hypothetical protein
VKHLTLQCQHSIFTQDIGHSVNLSLFDQLDLYLDSLTLVALLWLFTDPHPYVSGLVTACTTETARLASIYVDHTIKLTLNTVSTIL